MDEITKMLDEAHATIEKYARYAEVAKGTRSGKAAANCVRKANETIRVLQVLLGRLHNACTFCGEPRDKNGNCDGRKHPDIRTREEAKALGIVKEN